MLPYNKLGVKDLKMLECMLEIIYEKVQLVNTAMIDAEYRVLPGYVTSSSSTHERIYQVTQM